VAKKKAKRKAAGRTRAARRATGKKAARRKVTARKTSRKPARKAAARKPAPKAAARKPSAKAARQPAPRPVSPVIAPGSPATESPAAGAGQGGAAPTYGMGWGSDEEE